MRVVCVARGQSRGMQRPLIAEDPAFDLQLAARSGAGVMLAAAGACALAGWIDEAPRSPSAARIAFVVGVLAAIAALTTSAAAKRCVPVLAALGASGLLSVAVAAGGTVGGTSAVVYVAVALYGGYFLSHRAGSWWAAATAVAYGAAVLAGGGDAAAFVWAVVVATVIATTLLVARLRDRIRSLVTRLDDAAREDALTSLLNRRGVSERLALELARAERQESSVSCLVGDLNGFKAVNDRFGHQAGDRVLERVAAVLRNGVRASDGVGRLGGDEFVVVLPDTEGEAAVHQAGRLSEMVARAFAPEAANVTISFGTAAFPNDAGSVADLLNIADVALYAAKRAGGS
jgi:diguanylate cyclase (GGDEF)-like protein